MTEKRFTIDFENGVITDTTTTEVYSTLIQFKELLNELSTENRQLKQQMQRLYNYFADWFEDSVPPSAFSEMWDFVIEDENWD